MEFCPKCGSVMKPEKKGSKIYLVCPRCGYKIERKTKHFKIEEKTKEEENIFEIQDLELLPRTHKLCPKCGNHEAFYWVKQTRSMDEPPTTFFKCTKCGYIWREY